MPSAEAQPALPWGSAENKEALQASGLSFEESIRKVVRSATYQDYAVLTPD